MHEGLRRRALWDPNSGDHQVGSELQHRAGANGFSGYCRRAVRHQLLRRPAHDLCSVSLIVSHSLAKNE